MSAIVQDVVNLPKDVITEVKDQVQPASKSGIISQAVGFALGIPVSMFYDWLYEMVASRIITNEMARKILKIVLPLGVGVAIHISKLPFGNILAGTAYGVAIVSAIRMLIDWIKVRFGKKSAPTDAYAETAQNDQEISLWGVQQ